MDAPKKESIFNITELNVWYGKNQILKNLTFNVYPKQVTAFIGPTNSGKTTLVRCLNRLNDYNVYIKHSGKIEFKGEDVYASKIKTYEIAQKIGMIFQEPIPFRRSIYENIAYSARLRGINQTDHIDEIVKETLNKVQLWDEVQNNLHDSTDILTKGQQQMLCIARAVAGFPEVIIFDEPCKNLDAAETPILETVVQNLKSDYTIIFVTNKRRQAARVSDVAGFLYCGELIEFGYTEQIFTNPKNKLTENYVAGRMG